MNNKQKAIVKFLVENEGEDVREVIKDVRNITDFERADILSYDLTVYTDEEADEVWEESMDNYIEECVLNELPEQYRQYFDDEKFKRDCSFDGRGHGLSSYDGEEHEVKIDDTWYYIYKN